MKTINVSEETWEKIKDQVLEEEDTALEINELDEFIDKKLFIRTVTYHVTGQVVNRVGNLFELKDAAWIADSGRFMDAIKKGELNEVEPVGQMWVNIESIVDIFPWTHKLPKEQK